MLRLGAHCRVVEVDMYVAARIKLLLTSELLLLLLLTTMAAAGYECG